MVKYASTNKTSKVNINGHYEDTEQQTSTLSLVIPMQTVEKQSNPCNMHAKGEWTGKKKIFRNQKEIRQIRQIQTEKQKNRKTEKQTNRQTEKQTNRQIYLPFSTLHNIRNTDKQINRNQQNKTEAIINNNTRNKFRSNTHI